MRIETISEDRIDLLKESGCVSATIAIEAFSEEYREKVLKRKMKNETIYSNCRKLLDSGIKLRNCGTSGSPLDAGASQLDATWSNSGSTTINCVTATPHNLKTGDIIYVLISSNTTYVTVGSKTLTAAGSSTTFAFACKETFLITASVMVLVKMST